MYKILLEITSWGSLYACEATADSRADYILRAITLKDDLSGKVAQPDAFTLLK